MNKKIISTETTVVTEQSPLLPVTTEEEIKKAKINDALKFFNLLYLSSSDKRHSYLWLKKDEKEKLTVSFPVGNEDLHRTMAEAAIRYSDEGWDV